MLQSRAMTARSNVSPALHTMSLPLPPALNSLPDGALFLDFDGTLVDIAPHPDAIQVPSDLPDRLTQLSAQLGGRLALISGRSLADLDKHLGRLDLAMAGSHGGEIRPAGSNEVLSLTSPLPGEVVSGLQKIAQDHGGLLVERKPFSAAIHYRANPEAETDVVARANALGKNSQVAVKRGKMVVELVMPGSDKGRAVMQFMEMPEFSGAHAIFVGDDITDEDAFKAIRNLQGEGVLVGPERETAATSRLASVDDVYTWLGQALT